MPKTRLISPGSIPNHKLLKNLQLQDNYISNDGGDEGIRIDNDGKVGIGNTVPGATLEVSTTAATGIADVPIIEISSWSDAQDDSRSSGILKFQKVANDTINTFGADSHTAAGEVIGRIEAFGVTNAADGSSDAASISSCIEFAGDAIAANAAVPGKINFYTSTSGSGAVPPLRMTIDDGGNVGIGVAAPDTLLEIFGTSTQLKLSHNANDYATFTVADTGDLTIATVGDGGTDSFLKLEADGDVILDCTASDHIKFTAGGAGSMSIDPDSDKIVSSGSVTIDAVASISLDSAATAGAGGIYISNGGITGNWFQWIDIMNAKHQWLSLENGSDHFILEVTTNGATTLSTVDADDALAHLSIVVDGNYTVDAVGDITLDAYGKQIYFAFNGTNYVSFDFNANNYKFMNTTNVNDYFNINVDTEGATTLSTVDADTAVAHLSIVADGHVEFDNCAVGFDRLSGTFGTSLVIDSPNDGTDIDFRFGNKYDLTLTDDMGSDDLLNLIFPAVSGNFILVLIHDPAGGYDIHDGAWKAYASDGSLADSTMAENGTDGEVRWAGGATPTLSANGRDIDIISIYWDADTQTALAVASLDFAAV